MPQRSFAVNVEQNIYQNALNRAQSEGKHLEGVLADFVSRYAGDGGLAQTTTYVVKPGDTLTRIARQFYGDPYKYPLIQRANSIDDAGRIWVGQVLTIPGVGGGTAGPITPQPMPQPQPIPQPQPAPQPTPQPTPAPQPQPSPQPQQPQPSPGSSSSEPANPSFMNGDFDEFQPRIWEGEPRSWRGFPEQIGKYWEMKIISAVKKKRVRFFSSPEWGRVAQALYGGGGLNYAYGGGNSQVIVSQYGYDLVFRQRLKARPGQRYRFTGLVVTFYKGSGHAATPDKIYKQMGIDPTGGSDHESPNIVWSDLESRDHAWITHTVEAVAQSEAITIFIRIENAEKNVGQTDVNLVYLDKCKLEAI